MTETLYPFSYGGNGGPGAPVTLAVIQASHSWQLLHPEVQRRAEALLIASGGKLGFGQGWRSPQQADTVFVQRHHVIPCPGITFDGKCWALNAGQAPSMPADRSYHCPTIDGRSVAIDFVGDMAWFDTHCAAYGFVNRIAGEIWHGQPVELPHARGDYNAAPAKYPLKVWVLPGEPPHPPTEHPIPTEDDDMHIGIYITNDGRGTILTGQCTKAGSALIVSWVKTPERLATLKANPDSLEFTAFGQGNFGATTLLGAVPPGWSAADFAEVVG